MKKILVAAAGLIVLSACNNVSGTLTVATGSTLQLKDKKGNVVTINSGNAAAQIANNKVVLKAVTSSGKNDTIELDASNLPQFDQSGSHTFLAKDTGQPVDIAELNTNTYNQSPDYRGVDICTDTLVVSVPCPPPVVINPPNNDGPPNNDHPRPGKDGGGQKQDPGKPHASFQAVKSTRSPADEDQGCTAARVFQGHQPIVFHYSGDGFEAELIFSDPATQAQLGTFLGYAYQSQRIVTFRGPCILERY